MKSIILTYAPIQQSELEIIKNTKIYKLALNHHAQELKPNARIISDYVLPKICAKFPQDKIISVREKLRYPSINVEYYEGEFKGATIISAIDYLISKKYKDILIIGDNSVNGNEFINLINNEINKIKNTFNKVNIYQYTRGNFPLPQMCISDFCRDE